MSFTRLTGDEEPRREQARERQRFAERHDTDDGYPNRADTGGDRYSVQAAA